MMNGRALLSSICLVITSVACAGSGALVWQNADVLLRAIKKDGASAVVQSLWGKPAWSEITAKITSGERPWVDVALALGEGSDAGASETLRDALFVGLGKNPAYILDVLPTVEQSPRQPFSLSTVCGGRTDPLNTYWEAVTELKHIEAAVEKVEADALRSKKQLCLKRLEEGAEGLKRFFEVSE